MMKVDHLSKSSFTELIRHIKDNISVRRVLFSHKNPPCLDKAPVTHFPRIDITLAGRKHMQYAYNNKIQDTYMESGDVHYCPEMCWKMPIWDTLHTMSSLVFSPEYIRFTYIDYNKKNSVYEREAAHIFYHTAQPMCRSGCAILHALDTCAEHSSNSAAAIDLMKALLEISLEELERDHPRSFGKAHATWLMINQYLKENFYYPINRTHAAEEFKLNPNYISRLFVSEGKKGFNETLRDLRMQHAAMLLKNTTLTVGEICKECGYLSTAFFTSAFKKFFGMPPAKYRCYSPSSSQQPQDDGEYEHP